MNKISLGKRLSTLLSMVNADEHYFYDLCCDHGQLGLMVYQTQKPKAIFLNDRVKSICDNLVRKIQNLDSSEITISVLNSEAQDLILASEENKFITIAGVGGPLLMKILDSLLVQLSPDDILLLSPHTKIHEVRNYLSRGDFSLLDERLQEDSGKYYEILKVSCSNKGEKVTLVGSVEGLWQDSCPIKRGYFKELITYYELKVSHQPSNFIELVLNDLYSLKKLIK